MQIEILHVVAGLLVISLLWQARIEWLLRQIRNKASQQETSIESQFNKIRDEGPNWPSRIIII